MENMAGNIKAVIWGIVTGLLMWNGEGTILQIIAISLMTYLIASGLYNKKRKQK